MERDAVTRKSKTLLQTKEKGRECINEAVRRKRRQIKAYRSVNQKLSTFLNGIKIFLQYRPATSSLLNLYWIATANLNHSF